MCLALCDMSWLCGEGREGGKGCRGDGRSSSKKQFSKHLPSVRRIHHQNGTAEECYGFNETHEMGSNILYWRGMMWKPAVRSRLDNFREVHFPITMAV